MTLSLVLRMAPTFAKSLRREIHICQEYLLEVILWSGFIDGPAKKFRRGDSLPVFQLLLRFTFYERHSIRGILSAFTKINGLVYRITDPLPRAWIVGQLLPIKKGTVKELTDGSFNPLGSALEEGRIGYGYDTPFS